MASSMISRNNVDKKVFLDSYWKGDDDLITFSIFILINYLPLSSEEDRLKTFLMWPHTSPSAEDMSKAGFFMVNFGKDTAECFSCEKKLTDWEPSDIPMNEHQKFSPNCLFVKYNRYVNNEMGELEVITLANNVQHLLKSVQLLCSDENNIFKFACGLNHDKDILTTLILKKYFDKTSPTKIYETNRALVKDALEAVLDEPRLVYMEEIHKLLDKFANQKINLHQINKVGSPDQIKRKEKLSEHSEEPPSPIGKHVGFSTETGEIRSTKRQTEGERLYNDNMRLIARGACKICYQRRANNVVMPCAHLSLCDDCRPTVTQCPICGTLSKKIIKIYTA